VTFVGALALLGACKKEQETRKPAEGEPARRAAQSFVHCVEQGGSGCVHNDPALGAWDAFSMLGWLASGSPLSILQALPSELEHHKSPKRVQRRFVEQVERQREPLRGAECRAERVDKLDAMIPKLEQAAQTRLTEMGLWSGDLDAVVNGLSDEAGRGLGGGYLVSMRCASDPFEIYVATTTQEQRQIVVGVLTMLPDFLGGEAPGRDAADGRLRGITIGDATVGVLQEGTIDPWVVIPVEEF
jgi:hypothetical protein